jgi:hypothetical protein
VVLYLVVGGFIVFVGAAMWFGRGQTPVTEAMVAMVTDTAAAAGGAAAVVADAAAAVGATDAIRVAPPALLPPRSTTVNWP